MERFASQIWKEFWPKGLLGLLVPIYQFGWKLYRERKPEQRRKALRQEIADLQKFLESLGSGESSPELEANKCAAKRELDEKLSELVGISSVAGHGKVERQEPGSADATEMPSLPIPLTSSEVQVDRTPGTSPAQSLTLATPSLGGHRLRRWFLLYRPPRRVAWISHTLFFVSLASLLATVPVALTDFRQDPAILAAPFVWLILTLMLRFWAGSFVAVRPSRLRRWLLLYSPSSLWGWLPRSLFFVSLIATLCIIVTLPIIGLSGPSADKDATLAMGLSLAFWIPLTLAFRAWARAFDPELPSDVLENGVGEPMSRFRRYFLLYIPHRRLVLLLHGLFYLGLIFFLAGIDNYFLHPTELVFDEAGHSMQAILVVPLGYILLVTLLIREWAATFEPAEDAARRRVRWLLLGWPARLSGLVPQVLYYLAALLLPISLFLPFEDHEHGGLSWVAPLQSLDEIFWVAIPILVIFVSSRRWAIGLNARGPLPGSTETVPHWGLWRFLLLDRRSEIEIWTIRCALLFAISSFALATRESDARLLRIVIVSFMLFSVVGWATSLAAQRRH